MGVNKGFPVFSKAFFLCFLVLFFFQNNLTASSHDSIPHTAHENEQALTAEEGTHHVEEGEHHEEYKAEEVIMHHISDAHEWHLFTIGHTHVTLPLPVILYSEKGLDVFLSSKFKAPEGAHGHASVKYYNGYVLHHEKIYLGEEGTHVETDAEGHVTNLASVTDLSITKNVASMMISFALMALLFISVAKAYAKRGQQAPKGLQSFLEPLILFVRNDVAKPNLGKKTDKYLPYLLTVFFFIWVNNLLGLLPGAANVTGNIAVTFTLAVLTLILTLFSGNKYYWGHIFNPPGVPKWLFPIMIPVEIVGVFTKPFALMIRLFANITAGHILILSIIGLIFLFSNNGQQVGTGFGVSLGAIPLGIFLYLIELLVAFLQAFIFTMLTALFIGQAVEDHGHHAHEEAHGHH